MEAWQILALVAVGGFWPFYLSPGVRERRRPGWIKSAQKFAAHPWQQSLIVGGFGGLVLAAILAQISRDAVWPYALGAGAAIAGPFLYRYWFGPHICRTYLEQPPPA